MIQLTFVQGDTDPSIDGALTNDDNGSALDLTDATSVYFQMRPPDSRIWTVNAAARVVGSPTLGTVAYDWGPNDLNVSGPYQCQWLVNWSGGRIQTQAIPSLISVRRR